MAQVPRYTAFTPASERASKAAKGSSRKRDTACELVLRRALYARGLRYRIDGKDLPGRPDVVFRKARVAIFCDGDFWHGRALDERIAKLKDGHNAPYWVAKITRNVERDRERTKLLEAQGWLVLRFWESDILKNVERVADDVLLAIEGRSF